MPSEERAEYEGGVGRLREAYDSLNYELVPVHDSLTVPSASPVWFDYVGSPGVTDATKIENALTARKDVVFVNPFGENGEAWHEFHVSATAFGEEAEDRAKVKVSTAGVSVFQDREEKPTREFFETLVEILGEAVDAELEWSGEDDG